MPHVAGARAVRMLGGVVGAACRLSSTACAVSKFRAAAAKLWSAWGCERRCRHDGGTHAGVLQEAGVELGKLAVRLVGELKAVEHAKTLVEQRLQRREAGGDACGAGLHGGELKARRRNASLGLAAAHRLPASRSAAPRIAAQRSSP